MGRINRELAKSIAMELPDVEVGSHHGTMDIRVRNKIFATFPKGTKEMCLKSTPADLDELVKQNPEAFSMVWGDRMLKVDLDRIDRRTLEALLVDSWMLAAPPALRRLYRQKRGNSRIAQGDEPNG